MAAGAHARWTRFAAALFAAAALLPALHAAASHHAVTAQDGVSVEAASGDALDGLPPESCPICLATRSVQGKALRARPQAPHAKTVAAAPALPPAPLLAGRAVPGAASPRAPPSA